MKALITNDDGITSTGLFHSKTVMDTITDTIAVAPVTQQSGAGHSITLLDPLRISEVKLNDGSIGYGISGTPTDCVIMGLFELMDEFPDIIVSGINMGENLSIANLTTSGTLGATFEASKFGIPAIAVSLQLDSEELKLKKGEVQLDFDLCGRLLKKLTKKVLDKGMPENVNILNLNVPLNPDTEKLKVTHLAKNMYTTDIESRIDPSGRKYYWIYGEPICDDLEGTDIHTIRSLHQPSITPLNTNFTSKTDINKWID
ncbi:MAG: 5'/3'-nucleotidase SurE [Methanobacteriaceae archaeon]|nr:5'/3'-nucleotidase SurE [Methanobacteriaceae archaeon]